MLQFVWLPCVVSLLVCVSLSLLQYFAVCCNVLQCVAVCCSVLQCVAVCVAALRAITAGVRFHECDAVFCRVL